MLRSVVRAGERTTRETSTRSEVDNPTPAVLFHGGDHSTTEPEQTQDIHVKHVSQILGLDVLDRRDGTFDADGVDQYVNRTESIDYVRHKLGRRDRLTHVNGE